MVADFLYPDHTLFEISLVNGAVNKLLQATWVHDSGHDQDGVIVPGVAYSDSHYMESVNLTTHAINAIFNANPCPNPDNPGNDIGADGIFPPCFGLPAPVPNWVLPQYRRDSTMTDATNKVTGPNEYHAARGLAWSSSSNLFYVSDELGIFKLTTSGDCTKLTHRPAFLIPSDTGTNIVENDAKGIAFVTVTNRTQLWVGSRMDESVSGNTNGWIMEVDPQTGVNLGQLALNYPPGGGEPVDAFGGLTASRSIP